ncbi:MAG: DEAD/DEAH box helicase family protein [bacterium]
MATAAGFGTEGLAFAGLGHAFHGPSQDSWGEDIARSYLGLGALKFSGWMGRGLAQGIPVQWTTFIRWQGAIVPQLAIFAGLLLSHRLEARLGLRPETDSDQLVANTIVAMINLQIGARLGHHLLGERFHRFQQKMELAGRGELRVGVGRAWLLDFMPDGPFAPVGLEGVRLPLSFLNEERHPAAAKERILDRFPKAAEGSSKTLLAEFGQHYERVFRKLEQVFGQVPDSQAGHYLSQLEQIEQRKAFWIGQAERLAKSEGEERVRFEQDIVIGLGLLREKLLRVGAEIFQEPLETDKKPRWRLRSRFEKEPADKPEQTQAASAIDSLPALVNRDVGYGKDLSLRDHQIAALHALRGRLRLLQSFIEDGTMPPPEALAGSIVMPVGGGKTRTMVASFAAALELGWMNAKAGDKLVILNHTDQIHGQNLKVAGLLSAYFKKKVGRSLKISEYKAEQKDVSGDLIVVSIPSIAEATKREAFQKSLEQALGKGGKVAMVAVDEVHHLGLGQGRGREIWAQAIQTIRDLSPQLFQVGFTATPTGREAGRLFTVRERELMQAGVTPRTYLVKVDGIDLSQLKVTSSGEFEGRALQSTLLGHPERNERIYAALKARGMRAEGSSPSGRAKLEPVLGFGQDLRHAESMAEGYTGYFAEDAGDLGRRRLLVLGKNRGKITAKELQEGLRKYRDGEVDGIVAVVSGMTQGQRDPVLEAVERGEIEAVFTVDALVEGADLYMFSHQIGARPTFSRFKKGQERGRINRRGPNEVGTEGQLLLDTPKILFDVVDRYLGDAPLIRYGDILGIGGHAQLKNGEMLDVLSGEPTNEVDRNGQDIPRNKAKKPLPPKTGPRSKTLDSDWTPLVEQLEKILSEQYRGDLESLALDLGETEGFVEGLLDGQGWKNSRWFLKRMGTLLYQDRQEFVRLYREPYLAAFREALAQIEAEGKVVSYTHVADRAWALYGQALPEGERPNRGTFRNLVTGSHPDPEVQSLLAASAWASRRMLTRLDGERVLSAFGEALAQIEAEEKILDYKAVADRAWGLYGQDLSEGERPSLGNFRGLVAGIRADPEVLALLEASSRVAKRRRTALQREDLFSAFREALAQIEAEGKVVRYASVADRAWTLYRQGKSEVDRPSRKAFLQMVVGAQADPEVLSLLETSAWVNKQTRHTLDRERALSAFREALAQIGAEGKVVRYASVADRAWSLYGRELSEDERPSLSTFEYLVFGSGADPEVVSLLEASQWVRKIQCPPKSRK